jgi:hypothetical protein
LHDDPDSHQEIGVQCRERLVVPPLSSNSAEVDPVALRAASCSRRSRPVISTGDLDIPIVGQFPAANLPLSNEFKASPVKVMGSTHR